jgi:cytochrome c peroxidase
MREYSNTLLETRYLVFLCFSLLATGDQTPLPQDTLPPSLALQAVPLGLDSNRPIPKDNPLTEAKVRLGRRLFFDPILSAGGTISCASCHQPEHGFSTATRFALGIGGKATTRNPPSLLNRAYGKAFFWDGRETTLEAQALRPIELSHEMGGTVEAAVQRLKVNTCYQSEFSAVFSDGVAAQNLARALASFERVLLLGDSRVDRFRAGEVKALDEREVHGLWLYESKGQCWQCHSGRNFTDEGFHNTGVSWGKAPEDLGRYVVTKQKSDRGRFKTPTLRGLTHTAPYMHDGSVATLEEVVEFYNRGGENNPYKDATLKSLSLSKEEVADLIAFLKALSEPPPKSK